MTEEREEYAGEADAPGTISFASELMQRWPRGFIRIPLGIVLDANLSAEAKVIAGILAWFGWDKDQVWPGMETLGKWMDRHRHTVAPWVKELVDQGWVTRRRQGLPARWHYTLHYERGIIQPEAEHTQLQVGHTVAPTGGQVRGSQEREPSNENHKNKKEEEDKGITHSVFTSFQTHCMRNNIRLDNTEQREAFALITEMEQVLGPLKVESIVNRLTLHVGALKHPIWSRLERALRYDFTKAVAR